MFSFFGKKVAETANNQPVVHVLRSDAQKLLQDLQEWLPKGAEPALLVAYISPHIDFNQSCLILKQYLENIAPQCQLLATCVFRFVRPPVPVSSGQAFRCDPASMI